MLLPGKLAEALANEAAPLVVWLGALVANAYTHIDCVFMALKAGQVQRVETCVVLCQPWVGALHVAQQARHK